MIQNTSDLGPLAIVSISSAISSEGGVVHEGLWDLVAAEVHHLDGGVWCGKLLFYVFIDLQQMILSPHRQRLLSFEHSYVDAPIALVCIV